MNVETTDRALTAEEAGELRARLRSQGWSSDCGWVTVGARSAISAVRAAGGGETRRTIAYLATLRSVDGGAPRVWKDGDVPAPPEADAREVMVADDEANEWQSETFEAPAATVGEPEDADEPAEEPALH